MDSVSPMLKAFLEQSKIDDIAADQREAQKIELKKKIEEQANSQLSRSQNISDYIKIESKLKKGELDQKPNVHPQFKNYDHSLEKTRIKFVSEDGLETGSVKEMFGDIFKD